MYKLQQWLLVVLASFSFFYGTPLYAQINLNIEIMGVNSEQEQNIRLYLSLEQQKDNAVLSEGRLYHLHKKAPQEIAKALQPYGYYRPEIKTSLVHNTLDQWLVNYTITPGLPLLVTEIDFVVNDAINKDPEFQTLITEQNLHMGDVFNQLKYEDFKSSLAKLAAERGYFNARFIKHRVEVDLNRYEARVHLHYDSGPRFHFGEVLLQQNVLKREFLFRYIPFKRGDPYTLRQMIDLQQALNDSDYFSRVEVSPAQPSAESLEIPINVKLVPRKDNRYTFGLGYGTDTGARTKFGWDIPRLNKDGHRFSTEASVSEIGYSMNFQYRVPVLNPRSDQIIYNAGVLNQKTTSSESTISTVGASLNRGLGLWRQSIAVNYQQEDYIVGSDQGISKLLMPSINLSRTWGRNIIYTLDGLRFDIGLRGASNDLLSDTDFLQLQGGIKAITSIGDNNRIIARGRLGGTLTDEFNQLPTSVRFFAGGGQSVRGYAYQSLGPVDSSGKIIGGRYLMIGSLEFERSLSDKWGVAVFYDAGNAFDNLDDKLEHAAGLGIRWKSPIGPVRLDIASAISQADQPWRLHINIGPDL